jgi:hypothetical protein
MGTPNYSEIVATTLENRSGVVADNVLKNSAGLSAIKAKGNVKPHRGGRAITQELFFAENSTYKRYSGYEGLDISPSEVISAAEYDIKQVSVAVSWSGLEEIQNAGKEQIVDLIEARIQNAESSMINGLTADFYSAGTADGGKQITGLQAQVADAPTSGTVAGINRATWSFWQNKKYSGTTDGGAAVGTTTIQPYMRALYTKTVRGRESGDLILADDNYWGFYHDSLAAHQRITEMGKGAGTGWLTLKFMNADVVLDGGFGGAVPANHMYFLQTKYMFWRPVAGRDMTPLKDKSAVNQDATVKVLVWAGNLTSNFLGAQGVLIA